MEPLESIGGWRKEYTVRRGRFFWWSYYDIMFEERPLLKVFDKEDAQRIVGLCNGAYNLGRMSVFQERIYEQFNKSVEYLGPKVTPKL